MAKPAIPPLLVVADTNVPLDLAAGREVIVDALTVIRRRLRGGDILIPPTVVRELAFLADHAEEPDTRNRAARFLQEHRQWGCRLINHVALGDGFVSRVADRLRAVQLLPAAEINDSIILVEAAALSAALLLSSDAHLRDIDFQRLKFELERFDLSAPVIASPRDIVRKFLR